MKFLTQAGLSILLSLTACIGASRNNWIPANAASTIFPKLVVSALREVLERVKK